VSPHAVAAAHADTTREADVLAQIFADVDRLSRADARLALQQDVAPMPGELMADEHHQRIWMWIRERHVQGELPTLRSAHAAPELQSVPAAAWERLSVSVETAAQGAVDVGLELRTLAEIAARRHGLQTLRKALRDLESGAPVAPTLSGTALVLGRIQDGRTRSHEAGEYASALESDAARAAGKMPGISTGIPKLDQLIDGGFRAGQFVIFAAPSGHGKTRWAAGMTASCLKQGIGVTYCSTEQGETDTWQDDETGEIRRGHRTVAALERIAYGVGKSFRSTASSRRRARAGRELVTRRTPDGRHALLHVYHDEMSITNLEMEATRAALRGHKVMFVDNLEHVEGRRRPGETKADYLYTVAHDLARTAQRTGLVVILLAQPKPECEDLNRPAKKTELADSRAIARPCDYIITGWHPAALQKAAYKASLQRVGITEADVARDVPNPGDPGLLAKAGMSRWISALIEVNKVRTEAPGGTLELTWDEHTGRWHDGLSADLPLPQKYLDEAREEEARAQDPLFGGKR